MATKTPPPPSAPASNDVAAALRSIPIAQLHESPLNPRKRFDETALEELAASMRKSGQLTPILARPSQNGKDPAFEIAAGHRRRRAGERAGLPELLVIVRDMDDAEFMEILTVENLQREDVHPLEEAQGFADLIKHAGYDVARIADRTGRSHRYVYDRLHLLHLTPELKALFLEDAFTVGHAVILARLTPDDQLRAMSDTQALFNVGGRVKGGELELDDRRKPMSVRELQDWVDHHVRFDATAEHVPELFPATAALVAPAIEQEEKVVSITHNTFVRPEAKVDGERTYGPSSWKRADGQAGSKECEYSVIGVVVVGPGRGESFRVCTAKKSCKTHWAKEQRQSKQRAESAGGATSSAPAKRPQWEIDREREDKQRAEWELITPAVMEAVGARVAKLPAKATGLLGDILVAEIVRGDKVPAGLKRGTSAEDLVRYLAGVVLCGEAAQSWRAAREFPKRAKALGIDLAKIRAAAAPKDDTIPRFPKTAAAKKGAAKKVRA